MNEGVEKDLLKTIHETDKKNCIAIMLRLKEIMKDCTEEGRFLVQAFWEELLCNGAIDTKEGGVISDGKRFKGKA